MAMATASTSARATPLSSPRVSGTRSPCGNRAGWSTSPRDRTARAGLDRPRPVKAVTAGVRVAFVDNAPWTLIKANGRPLVALVLLAMLAGASLSRYTVRRGDTLSGIAAKQKVAASDLARWNGIARPDRIVVGQR